MNDPRMESAYRLALSALGAIASGVVIVSRDGALLYANPRAAELLQRSIEELARANIAALFRPLDELLMLQRRAPGTDGRTELMVRRADRTNMTIGFTLSELPRLPGDVGLDRFVCVFQDISAHAAIRKERDGLLRRAVVAELLPSILHELKNPLAAMTTAVELLLEEVSDESVQRDLRGIFKEIRRLDLGMQGFAVAGRDLRSRQVFEAADRIREAVRVLEPVADDAQVRLRVEVDQLPPLALNVDVVRGMVFNVVRSCISACSAGDEIVISARIAPDGHTFELIAHDTGPAPPANILDSGVVTRLGRAGVALLLCKRACEAAAGTLELVASASGGSEVIIRVPFAVPIGGAAGSDTLY